MFIISIWRVTKNLHNSSFDLINRYEPSSEAFWLYKMTIPYYKMEMFSFIKDWNYWSTIFGTIFEFKWLLHIQLNIYSIQVKQKTLLMKVLSFKLNFSKRKTTWDGGRICEWILSSAHHLFRGNWPKTYKWIQSSSNQISRGYWPVGGWNLKRYC